MLRGDLDSALATGTSFIKSQGNLEAKKQGNRIFIDGIVTHSWDDIYDFSPEQSGGASATSLEAYNRAKKFNIKSKWQQRVTGTLQIKKGKLVNPKLKWQDIDSDKK